MVVLGAGVVFIALFVLPLLPFSSHEELDGEIKCRSVSALINNGCLNEENRNKPGFTFCTLVLRENKPQNGSSPF